jgi:hypothetical protein
VIYPLLTRRVHVLFVALAAVLFNTFANASAPLADHVPGDALAYIGWAGSGVLSKSYSSSDMSAFFDHSNLPQVARDMLVKLLQKIDDKEFLDSAGKAMPLLWRHPVAIYASDFTIESDGTPHANLALICQAGADVMDLEADLAVLARHNPRLAVVIKDNFVELSLNQPVAAPVGSTLADNSTFVAAMQKLQPSPALAVYADVTTILAKAGESASKDENAGEIWPKVRDALGLGGIKTYAMTAGFDGNRWMTASLLDAPSPRAGLLAAIEPEPIDPVLLARIPASAGSVSVCNFDAAKFYDTLADAMSVRKESDTLFHQASGLATVALGRNLRRQILGSLGSQWVLYCDAVSHRVVLMNHPVKPDDAEDAMVSATFGLVNLANARLAGTQPVANAVQSTVKGLDVTSAVTSFGSPSFAVNGQVLYFGLSAESVTAAATAPASALDKNVMNSAGFAEAAKRLGTTKVAGYGYCNLPITAPLAYENFSAIQGDLRKLMDLTGAEIPDIELPPIEQIKTHLSPALTVSWADAEGIYSKSISPFPGSTLLLGDPQQSILNTVTMPVLMPILQRMHGDR